MKMKRMSTLRAARERRGLRLIDLATLCDVGMATVWNLENGYEQRASKKTKEKIAAGLGMKEEELFPSI